MLAVSRRSRTGYSRRATGFTLIELLVVVAIIGVLVALMLPAVQQARESARRTHCFNNLKQYGLASQNFHQTYNRLPPYWSQNNLTKYPDGGWLLHMLPFMEEKTSYDIAVSSRNGQMTRTGTMTAPASTDPPYTPAQSQNNGGYWQTTGTTTPDPSQHMGHTYPRDPVDTRVWVGPPNTTIPAVGTPATYSYNMTGIYAITELNKKYMHCLSDPSQIGPSFKYTYNSLPWVPTNYQANFLAWVKDADQNRIGIQWPVGGAKLATADLPKLDAAMSYSNITDGTSNVIMFAEGMRLCDRNYRLAMWNHYNVIANSHNFGVEWNGKGNTFMFQSMPRRDRCNNWRVQALHFGNLSVVMFDGSVKGLSKEISRRETSNPDFPAMGVDAVFASADPSFEFDGAWDKLMMPTDGQSLGTY